MINHSQSIVKLANEDGNDGARAKGQTESLQDKVDKASPVCHKWSSVVRTSTLAKLLKQEGSTEAAVKWLEDLKGEIDMSTECVEVPLGMLVGMHKTMLRKQFADTKKPAKKARTS